MDTVNILKIVEAVFALAFAAIGLASIIVKFTPSQEDDNLIKKIQDILSKIVLPFAKK